MSTATLERPAVDVLSDLTAQAERASSRRRAALRFDYESALAAFAFGDPVADDQLAAFHESRVAAGVGDHELEEDLRQLRLFRDSCRKPLVADADLLAEVERGRKREEEIRAELKTLQARRVEIRYSLEFAARTRSMRQAVQLRERFSSLNFDALRGRLEIADGQSELPVDYKPRPTEGMAAILANTPGVSRPAVTH